MAPVKGKQIAVKHCLPKCSAFHETLLRTKNSSEVFLKHFGSILVWTHEVKRQRDATKLKEKRRYGAGVAIFLTQKKVPRLQWTEKTDEDARFFALCAFERLTGDVERCYQWRLLAFLSKANECAKFSFSWTRCSHQSHVSLRSLKMASISNFDIEQGKARNSNFLFLAIKVHSLLLHVPGKTVAVWTACHSKANLLLRISNMVATPKSWNVYLSSRKIEEIELLML